MESPDLSPTDLGDSAVASLELPSESPASPSHGISVKQGWLHKLGYLGKGWKKRFVELHILNDNVVELRYGREFRASGDVAPGFALTGVISLADAQVCQVSSLDLALAPC